MQIEINYDLREKTLTRGIYIAKSCIQPRIMTTPAMAFASCARIVLFSFLSIWIFTLVVSRLWSFHHALQSEFMKRKNESWLVKQCDDPEFYFRLKEHTDLCTTVTSNANSNPFLNALYSMAISTHLCGTSSCTEMLQSLLRKLGWQVVGLLLLLALFSPNILFLIYRSSVYRHLKNQERGLASSSAKHSVVVDTDGSPWSACYPLEVYEDQSQLQPQQSWVSYYPPYQHAMQSNNLRPRNQVSIAPGDV